ncbi:MAG: hypothetical protein ACKOAU_16490 [Pirellula sp.]
MNELKIDTNARLLLGVVNNGDELPYGTSIAGAAIIVLSFVAEVTSIKAIRLG